MEDKVETAPSRHLFLVAQTEEVFLYPESDSPAPVQPEAKAPPHVVVVGAGALGCAAARTLAQESGLAITLVDDDRVELSNLQRQVLYRDADVGELKVHAAAANLARDFGANVRAVATRFDERTGPALLESASVVIDGSDDPVTKFLVARLAREAGVASVHGGVARTGGQWMLTVPGVSACLACVFPEREGAIETAAGCSALGILAPVAGVVGAMQALMTIAFLKRPARAIAGRLHVYELTGARSRHVDFPPAEGCPCGAAGRNRTFRADGERLAAAH